MRMMQRQRHNCGKHGWATCTVCNGRIHLVGCTTRRDKHKDCCEARHKMFRDKGLVYGLADKSQKL